MIKSSRVSLPHGRKWSGTLTYVKDIKSLKSSNFHFSQKSSVRIVLQRSYLSVNWFK